MPDDTSNGCTHFNPRSPHGERLSPSLRQHGEYYFNPRSPHGERRVSDLETAIAKLFQSTLPARGATKNAAQTGKALMISIHAPRTGSDEDAR